MDGLLTNTELIDSLIVDCNVLVKHLISGQFIAFCAKINEMAQKLSNLKDGVKKDTESLHKQIIDQNEQINSLANRLFQYEKGECGCSGLTDIQSVSQEATPAQSK